MCPSPTVRPIRPTQAIIQLPDLGLILWPSAVAYPQVVRWATRAGGKRLFVFPALNLVVAMNCGNYRKCGLEQNRVNTVVLTEVVLPSFI